MNKMNIFNNPKIRWSVISFFAAVQILGFVVFLKAAIENHLLFLSFMYLGLGFLSLDWRQGIINIICLTCPVFFLMLIIFFIIAIFNGNLGHIITGIRTSVTLWGLVLITGLPVFIFGFGIRWLTQKFFIKG